MYTFKNFLNILAIYFIASLSARCQQSNKPVIKQEDTLINLKNIFERQPKNSVFVDTFKADYTVLDGLLVDHSEDFFTNRKIVRTYRLKDFEELSKIGVLHPTGSYEFLYTEPSDFYRYAYSKIRKDIPIQLLDMQFPLLIDGQIIPLSQSGVADRLNRNSIKKIEFLPKSSPEISSERNVIYGAIKIVI